jgi:hypothetical protein
LRGALSALLFVAFLGPVAAQTASYTYFGPAGRLGCSPVGPVLQHQVVGLPTLGSNFTALVPMSNGGCSYLCNLNFLVTGLSNTQWGGVPLPVSVSPIYPCGDLLMSIDLITPIPNGTIGALHPVVQPIPSHPALVGATFFQQMLSLQYILGGFSTMAFGRAGQAVIGP